MLFPSLNICLLVSPVTLITFHEKYVNAKSLEMFLNKFSMTIQVFNDRA